MSIVKSFSVGNGDTYYIRHNSDNFSVIDCNLIDGVREKIVKEIKQKSNGVGIWRFISTHPDDDHIHGLEYLDDKWSIANFYCVANEATKDDETDSFKRYCELRDDSKKSFKLSKGCSRRWMNESSEERGSAGINVHWPITSNEHYKEALKKAKKGESPNNLSIIVSYSLENGVTMMWFGDLETEFMKNITDDVDIPTADIIFAPHHGRKSGRLPSSWLKKINPKIIVVGEAPSKDLEYYSGYNTIKQNSAGDIVFDCVVRKVQIYCSISAYKESFLENEKLKDKFGCSYLGTLKL